MQHTHNKKTKPIDPRTVQSSDFRPPKWGRGAGVEDLLPRNEVPQSALARPRHAEHHHLTQQISGRSKKRPGDMVRQNAKAPGIW